LSASNCAIPRARSCPFAPGAHIDLHLANGLVRNYSLCGAPEQRDRYTVGVLNDATAAAARVSCTSSCAWAPR
jgi:ferredoxin-NADP reductase